MAQGDLSRIYFSKAFEAAIDTSATLDVSLLGTLQLDPKHKENIDKNVSGVAVDVTVTRTGLSSSGSFAGDVTANHLAILFKAVFQSPPTTTGVGDPYSHAWTDIADTGGMSATAAHTVTAVAQVAGLATYIDKFTGLMMPSLTIAGTGEGMPTFNAPIEGSGTVVTTTEPVVAIPTEGYFRGVQTALSIDGVDKSKRLVNYSLMINNAYKYVPRGGSTTGSQTSIDREGSRPYIELTYELNEGAVGEAGGHDDWPAGTKRTIVLTLSGDANRDCVITLENCRLMDGFPIKTNVQGVYKTQRKVRALYNALSGPPKWFSVVVRNNVAAYT